mgnify:FL=1
MLGENYFTVQYVEAQIQAKVAGFLGQKIKLVELQSNQNVSSADRYEIDRLYNDQIQFEGELQDKLNTISQIKSGVRSGLDIVSDVAMLSLFATQLAWHIDSVNDYIRKYGGTITTEDNFNMMLFAGAGILAGLLIVRRLRK